MKKFICFIMAFVLLFSFFSAEASYLYTESFTERVSGGVFYEQKNILTEDGWIRAYVAYVDISNPNTAIKVMTAASGSSYLSTVKNMASANGSLIAVNGDFFNFSSGQTNMLGMVYKNGELVSTPALDNQASFVLTDDNQVIMEYFSFEATVTSPQGYPCPIYQINKIPVDTGAVTMLTSEWASKTWGSSKLKELVVENDVVTQIREPGSGSGTMPSNGYILVTNPEINGFFDNFQVGDTVTVDVKLTPDINNIKEATGGNTLIVNDGKIAKFTGNVSGYAQRTAVGVTADGKTVILAATDGRQTECKGLTQTSMAELMISLGAHKAINLDGGGSTTFVKRDYSGNQQVMNSVSSLRSVSTGIGVFTNNVGGEYAAGGKLTADREMLLSGDSVTLTAEFYDEFGNFFYPDPWEITYLDEAGNVLANGVFTPTYAGVHTLYAKAGNVTVSTQVEAVDDVYAIRIDGGDFDLPAESSKTLTVYGYNINGKKFAISPHLISWSSDSDEIAVINGTVTATSKGGAAVSAQYKNKIDYVVVNKNEYGYKAPRSTDGSDEFRGVLRANATVAVSGNVPSGATLLNKVFAHKRLENLSEYSTSVLTGNYYTGYAPKNAVMLNGYNVKVYDSSTFVTLNTSGNYIKTGELANLCIAANGSSKNIVVITQKTPDELGLDGDRIRKILSASNDNGKNVFYVTPGSESSVTMEGGVRYITVGTVSDYHTSSYASDAYYCTYVLFTVNGEEIRYEFKTDI